MNTRPSACAWQAATDLLWTQFDDSPDWAIYHPASSSAHLVSDAARRLWLLASSGRASDPESLGALLAAEADQIVTPEFQAAVTETIAFLDRSGLLRPRRL